MKPTTNKIYNRMTILACTLRAKKVTFSTPRETRPRVTGQEIASRFSPVGECVLIEEHVIEYIIHIYA
jgi:hypothetical protein